MIRSVRRARDGNHRPIAASPEAAVIRCIDPRAGRIVGTFFRFSGGGRLVSADRRDDTEYEIVERDAGGAEDGELVVAEELPSGRFGAARARVVERLGPVSDPGSLSRLVIAAFDLPTEFPAAALAEAAAAAPPDLAGRCDLRGIPLVTIDGADARDFDDAVWAEPDPDPANAGGWHIIVAIADVAWYVPPGSALDCEAARRGNSVYFPDRVIPMLPEALSNELCSLQPGVDRACLAADLWIDAGGRKRRHRFTRALMRSAARLTYEEAQAAHDERGDLRAPVSAAALAALYGAYRSLAQARAGRGAIELEIREERVALDTSGRPAAIMPTERLDSHRLIEELMILANVAAAEELESRQRPCMYRVHDAPDPKRLQALHDFLAALGLPSLALAKGQAPKPAMFNGLLRRAAATSAATLVNDLVLRCQARAVYSPANIGHFGLALRRYAHFTSPIRRYADLLVHRALVDTLDERPDLAALGEHISATERVAAAAERAALDRCRALLTVPLLGDLFVARVSGVARFGLFVTLSDNGATGLVPISGLPTDFYRHDERAQRLVGKRSGYRFRLGDEVSVRLVAADPVRGRLVFGVANAAERVSNCRTSPKRRKTGGRRRS
jgi:ribonuclease R